jgi:hypothetical protein
MSPNVPVLPKTPVVIVNVFFPEPAKDKTYRKMEDCQAVKEVVRALNAYAYGE